MRTFYSVLFYLLIPFILLRLAWRSIKAPGYRQRWGERLGFYGKTYPQNVVWFHAVSVGEAEAVFPLVRCFQQRMPEKRILITTTTPTGSARVTAVMGHAVEHVYLPYDVPAAIERFMRCFKPVVAVIVETEIWPNLYHCCARHKLPLYLVNARLSERSTARYKKIPGLIHPVLATIRTVAAQTEGDAKRFIAIGAASSQVITVGNIKFDIEIPLETLEAGRLLKANGFEGRFVLLAASTHKGEEQLLFDIYKLLKADIPHLLLIVVPSHPQRFIEVGQLAGRNRLVLVNRASGEPCEATTDVYLADTMGELKLLYAAADLAFIGGSMVDVGGHNLLEAAAVGVPVLFGPFMANFKEIADKVIAHGAAVQCPDSGALARAVLELYSDSNGRIALSQRGMAFLQQNRGVTEKLYSLLAKGLQ